LGPEKPVRQDRSPDPQGAQIRYLLLSEIRRLLDYLKVRQQGYGSGLAFYLANALFQTACRFDELIQLTWADCQRVGEEIVALHGLRHSAATILLNQVGKDLREIQELLRHKKSARPSRSTMMPVGKKEGRGTPL
jgi:integrase